MGCSSKPGPALNSLQNSIAAGASHSCSRSAREQRVGVAPRDRTRALHHSSCLPEAHPARGRPQGATTPDVHPPPETLPRTPHGAASHAAGRVARRRRRIYIRPTESCSNSPWSRSEGPRPAPPAGVRQFGMGDHRRPCHLSLECYCRRLLKPSIARKGWHPKAREVFPRSLPSR